MSELLLRHETILYALVYWGALAAVGIGEGRAPRRAASQPARRRWLGNFGFALGNAWLQRALFPLLGVALALLAEDRGWGLLRALALPGVLAPVVGFLALDLVKYAEHRLMHRVPLLWRAHRLHHTDPDVDFTTALRTHPLESLAATGVDLAAIAVLGLSPAAVLLYELAGAAVSFFSHGNLRLPQRLDRALRLFVITPDLHRVHHSRSEAETNANLGALLPWWDRLFGTYVAQPAAGHLEMLLGLTEFPAPRHLGLGRMLANPFLSARPGPERSR